MTMTKAELYSAVAPFKVRDCKTGKVSTITGFSKNDPLDVGGGLLPDMPVAYFKNGGWLLITDVLEHYKLEPPK